MWDIDNKNSVLNNCLFFPNATLFFKDDHTRMSDMELKKKQFKFFHVRICTQNIFRIMPLYVLFRVLLSVVSFNIHFFH